MPPQQGCVARWPAGGAHVPVLSGAHLREEVTDPAVLRPHGQTARLQAYHRLWVQSLQHTEIKKKKSLDF